MIKNLFAIFIGGGIGATLRYLFTVFFRKYLSLAILGTLSANMLGCLLMGIVFGIVFQKSDLLPNALKLFITVGFLGGLTTFSTLNLEIFEYIQSGKIYSGLFYLLASCILGLSLTALGFYLTELLFIPKA